jgi:hypothetical protein
MTIGRVILPEKIADRRRAEKKVFTRQPISQARTHSDRAVLLTPGYES